MICDVRDAASIRLIAGFAWQREFADLQRPQGQLATRLRAGAGPSKVAAVAEAVGYESQAAFSRAFKKCVGVAPAAWRLRGDT